jgi:hypothetical protein
LAVKQALRGAVGLVLAAEAALAMWLAWRSLHWPLIHDGPIMHYIAWRISEGAVPYRDIFDMNFPGAYLVHLLIITTLGTGDVAWRVADLTAVGVASACIAALAAPWGRVAAAGGAIFFAAYHLAGGAWNAGQRDFFLCPFLLAGALGVSRWAEGRGVSSLLAGGLALGAGATIKPHAVVFVAGVLAAVVVRARGHDGAGTIVAFLVGVAAIPLIVVAWLASLGALGAWRDIVVDYLVPLYSRVTRPGDWFYYRWHSWIAILSALGLTVARLLWTRRAGSARHVVVLLGVAYGVLHFLGQRKGWEYHLYPLAAFAAVLLFSEVGPLVRTRRLAAVPLLASLGAVVVLLGVKGAHAADSAWIATKERRVAALTNDLAAIAAPGDFVHVLDTTDGGLHALLRRHLRTPTRFIYDFHFFHHVDEPGIQRLRAELVSGLRARPPRAIVLWKVGWPNGGYDRVEEFPALAHVLSGYTLAREKDGYRIYAK